jgi:hypothetical protein
MKLVLKLIVVLCVIAGGYVLYTGQKEKGPAVEDEAVANPKAAALKTFLAKYKKPQRVEVTNLTQRFADDAEEIKKLKLPLDPKSTYYIAINLFTDETDSQAPLVAQIKFMDIATENKLSEENINLE